MTPAKPHTADEIAAALARFVAPDQYTELRALNVGSPGRTFAGWFRGDQLRDLARAALGVTRESSGCYFFPSPVFPSTAHRRLGVFTDARRGFQLTRDGDIVDRRYLIVDVDPTRYGAPSNGPASGRELGFAARVARRSVAPFMLELGFAPPVVMLSGNGVHLVYRIDPIPATVEGVDVPARVLRILHERFTCDGATVDPNTYKPTTMLKVPGTLSRKGNPGANRPFRVARIVSIPDAWTAPALVGLDYTPDAPTPERPRPDEPDRRSEPVRPGLEQARPGGRPAAPRARPEPARLFDPGRQGDPSGRLPG